MSLLGGCAATKVARYDAGTQRMCQGSMCYRTGTLTKSWQVVHVEQASVSYFNSELNAIIESNASCRDDAEATPLETLTNHLLLGYTERNYKSSDKVPLANREALHTVVEAKLDGVPMVLDLYVMKRNGCIFDLSFAAPPARFGDGSTAFSQFVQGFVDESKS